MAGFVYIMSNPAFPDLLKIGKSSKDPTKDRVNELNQTGLPQPFQVEYYAFVGDEDLIESLVHKHFKAKRPNKKREFFNVACTDAISTIRDISEQHSSIKYEEVFYVSPEELEAHRVAKEKARAEEQARIQRERDRLNKAESETAAKHTQQRMEAEKAAKQEKEIAEERVGLEKQREKIRHEQNFRIGIVVLLLVWPIVSFFMWLYPNHPSEESIYAIIPLALGVSFVPWLLITVLVVGAVRAFGKHRTLKDNTIITPDIECIMAELRERDNTNNKK